jgi:hypothetical protein
MLPPRPAQALRDAFGNRVAAAGDHHEGDGTGRIARRRQRRGANDEDDVRLTLDELERDRGQPILASLGIRVIEHDVLAGDVAALAKSIEKRVVPRVDDGGPSQRKDADARLPWHRLCAEHVWQHRHRGAGKESASMHRRALP